MSIYCHGMSTYEPKEYLTLPAGYRENYAEIYDKRLVLNAFSIKKSEVIDYISLFLLLYYCQVYLYCSIFHFTYSTLVLLA